MKTSTKILLVGSVILFFALSPVIGKAVENTTKSLFPGLSTDKKLETVADVVDDNRLQAEFKIKELQSIIDSQQVKLAEQQKQIEASDKSIVQSRDCSADVAKYCQSWFMTPESFESHVSNRSAENEKIMRDRFTTSFNRCQNALSCQ